VLRPIRAAELLLPETEHDAEEQPAERPREHGVHVGRERREAARRCELRGEIDGAAGARDAQDGGRGDGGEEHCQKSRLEQEAVPRKAREVARCVRQREQRRPAGAEQRTRRERHREERRSCGVARARATDARGARRISADRNDEAAAQREKRRRERAEPRQPAQRPIRRAGAPQQRRRAAKAARCTDVADQARVHRCDGRDPARAGERDDLPRIAPNRHRVDHRQPADEFRVHSKRKVFFFFFFFFFFSQCHSCRFGNSCVL
jgi:hypothetical protein